MRLLKFLASNNYFLVVPRHISPIVEPLDAPNPANKDGARSARVRRFAAPGRVRGHKETNENQRGMLHVSVRLLEASALSV